ncbi:unannotated protein [freshwater metagenome]|uniref:Unannotated protein n=1 Tax=freshwater metagenome TaxID=449393 RepID=A0A6J7EVY4_9ZZZZ|nr:hypothetical protein [Actinomycetota bacterium]
MRKVREEIEEEDSTHQGGWLFADSFLALMVIFLATISFVPSLGGGLTGTGNIGNIAGGNYVKGLNIAYESFDAAQIKKDIDGFIAGERLPRNSKVLFAKIVGGFDKNTETDQEGQFRALLFSAQITKAQIAYFSSAKVDLGSSKLLKPNQIVLRLTLSP